MKTENRLLADQNLKFKSPNKLLNSLVTRYSFSRYGREKMWGGWDDLNNYLLTKPDKGINLKLRKRKAKNSGDRKATMVSVIKEKEFPIVLKGIVSLCNNNGVDIEDILSSTDFILGEKEKRIN